MKRLFRFLETQTAEIAHFHDVAFARVHDGERVERVVERLYVVAGGLRRKQRLVQRQLGRAAAAFLVPSRAREVYENPPHHPRRHGEEVRDSATASV